MTSRWSLWVGVALVVVAGGSLVAAVLRGNGTKADPGLAVGQRLPAFAAPLVRSALEGDTNVATRPDQGGAGARPACSVRGDDVLNGCQLAEDAPAVLTLVGDVGSCLTAVSAVETLARRRRNVTVAAVVMRGDRDRIRSWLDRERITVPVGWDRDGVLGALYDVVVCPQTTIVDTHGRVAETVYGQASAEDLSRRVDRLTSR